MSYKQFKDKEGNVRTDVIQRTSDGSWITVDESNIDYQAYLAWVAEGNTPEAADQTVYKLTTRT